MLKIKYSLDSGMLTGWLSDTKEEFESVTDRESVANVKGKKPPENDYQGYLYQEGELVSSGRLPTPLEGERRRSKEDKTRYEMEAG